MCHILFSLACGGLLQSSQGTVSSPNYPSSYPPNTECEWEIRVDSGYILILNVNSSFDLQPGDCSSDYLEVGIGDYFLIHHYYVCMFFFLAKCFEPTFSDGDKWFTNQHIIIINLEKKSLLNAGIPASPWTLMIITFYDNISHSS